MENNLNTKLNVAEVGEISKIIADYRNRLIDALCNENAKLDCHVSPYALGETHVIKISDGHVFDEVGDAWVLEDLTLEDLIYIFEDLN